MKAHAHPSRRHWTPHWLTVISALLFIFSFPPWDFWPLIWFWFIPWLWGVKHRHTWQDAAIQGMWLSIIISFGAFHWVAAALKEYGDLPWSVAFMGLLLFSFIGQPQFPIFAIALKKLLPPSVQIPKTNPWSGILTLLALAFIYTGIDWIVPKIFMDTLGHSLYRASHLRQFADIAGPFALTFLIFSVNYTLWTLIVAAKAKSLSNALPQAFLTLALVITVWGYGAIRSTDIQNRVSASTRSIQAAAIQGNIGDFDKLAAERGLSGAGTKVIDTFTSMTDQALVMTPRPDVVIWPETSYPSTFGHPRSFTDSNLDSRVRRFSKERDIPILFGGYDHFERKDFNAFFFLAPQGDLQTYRKSVLLAFGEYIPGADTFTAIKKAFPQVGFFGRGPGPEVVTIPTVDPDRKVIAAPIICYEALFTQYLVESARKGSELILNITNDSWFGTWGEPQLHLALTVFRSIETRLPMLRTTNTGISTLIQADGEITQATPIGVPRILNVRVPITAPIPTLIKSWGDWFGVTSLVLGILAALGLARYRDLLK